jgi:uncharacterized protein
LASPRISLALHPRYVIVEAAYRTGSEVPEQILLAIAMAVIAAAYAAVGQGGATGYIAVMGLIGFGPEIIRPAALSLNALVSAIAAVQFAKAGQIKWRSIFPFAAFGVPCSVLGGATHLSAAIYHPLVGILLLIAAWQMARSARRAKGEDDHVAAAPPLWASLLAGAAIGFVAGITGIGGGILLAPLMLALGWAGARQTSGAAAIFNLLNSAAALGGLWLTIPALPALSPWWFVAAAGGGLLGSWLGARHVPTWFLRYALATLLVIAAVRMLSA